MENGVAGPNAGNVVLTYLEDTRMSKSQTEQASINGRGCEQTVEDEDTLAVRRAVAEMHAVTPEREGVRIMEVPILGWVGLKILWGNDPSPDAEQGGTEDARRLHESGRCSYICSVQAVCGHKTAKADRWLPDGGDAQQIERDLAEEVILDLMDKQEMYQYHRRRGGNVEGTSSDRCTTIGGTCIPIKLENTPLKWPYPGTKAAGRKRWDESWVVLAHACGLVGKADYRASVRPGDDDRRAQMQKAASEAVAHLRKKLLARLARPDAEREVQLTVWP